MANIIFTINPLLESNAGPIVNLATPKRFNPTQNFIDFAANARVLVDGAGQTTLDGYNPNDPNPYVPDPITYFPSEIPTGYSSIEFVRDWPVGDAALDYFAGDFVIRHNLPGDYTIGIEGTGPTNLQSGATHRMRGT